MRFGRDYAGLDLYETLGVAPAASAHEIRTAYRREVRSSHPDLHPDNPALATRMRELNLAARVLLDPAARATYDGFRAVPRDERERPRSWWERSSDGPCDWVEPPEALRREPVPLAWMEGLRGRVARAFARFDEQVLALPPCGRLLVGTLGVGLALILLAAARPRLGTSAGGDRLQPVSISPALLTP